MIISRRYIVSLIMLAIYLLTVFRPIVSVAMQITLGLPAASQCSGDCRVDGCSLEKSAAHACCCWQMARKEKNDISSRLDPSLTTDHKTTEQVTESPRNGSCCGASQTIKAEKDNTSKNKRLTYISSTPCGSGKAFVLPGFETSQHIPIFFTEETASPIQSRLSFNQPKDFTSRYCEPPDPPPII